MVELRSKTTENNELLQSIKSDLRGVNEQLGDVVKTLASLTGNGHDPSGGKIGRMERDIAEGVKDRNYLRSQVGGVKERVAMWNGIGIGINFMLVLVNVAILLMKK